MTHATIAIATYRRPQGLRKLLASLDRLTFTRVTAPRLSIVVVDNDAASPLAPDAATLKAWSRHEIHYRIEPQRGLSAVRNACLDHVPETSEVVAFLDDDEWVDAPWLDALLAKRQATLAGVIQGPVRPVYAAPPAPWLTVAPFHEVGPFVDGQRLDYGATGNCLLDRVMLTTTGVRFDPRFNVSGGEDTDFFKRLARAGVAIIAAADAVAYETVPIERMARGWVLKRQMRVGHTLGVVARAHGETPQRLLKAGLRFAQGAALAFAGAPLALVGRDALAMRGLANMAWGCGTVSAYLGKSVDHYS